MGQLVEPVERKPKLSVVVVVYNMSREAPRTLYSLSADYQRYIDPDDYEVIVVDNGSSPRFDPQILSGLSGNFRLIRIDPAPPSPAHAINRGLAEAQGDVVGVMIDGARLVTPGLLHFARHGSGLYDRAVVASTAWFLGHDDQRFSIDTGYNQQREDALLESIGWPAEGYRLFEIATPANSSINGWLLPIAESNALFLRRELWQLLDGYDERFDLPGGGLVNLDTYRRALELPDARSVMLLGEGSFHQTHGGIATNSDIDQFPETIGRWAEQYEAIRGKSWRAPAARNVTYLGELPRPALPHLIRSALYPIPRGHEEPLGRAFDRTLFSSQSMQPPTDPVDAALLDLIQAEFRAGRFEAAAAVARLAVRHTEHETNAQTLLAHASPWLRTRMPAPDRRAEFHLALGKGHRILGDLDRAAAEYRAALTFDDDLVEACLGLAGLRMPGEDYLIWLKRFHETIQPATYLEIGIARGQSLAYARAPAVVVGVDPEPMINAPIKAEAHIFCETSDVFFAKRRLEHLLQGHTLDLAFIDGLHVFAQSLKDFMNVESWCDARSIVLMHDTIPLDEPTQRPQRQKQFYTGDVWKTVLCLKRYRPDLDIFTIATPPSGLTVITGLDSASRVLQDSYEDAIERFKDVSFASVSNTLDTMLNVVPNDWELVISRFKNSGIICATRSVIG